MYIDGYVLMHTQSAQPHLTAIHLLHYHLHEKSLRVKQQTTHSVQSNYPTPSLFQVHILDSCPHTTHASKIYPKTPAHPSTHNIPSNPPFDSPYYKQVTHKREIHVDKHLQPRKHRRHMLPSQHAGRPITRAGRESLDAEDKDTGTEADRKASEAEHRRQASKTISASQVPTPSNTKSQNEQSGRKVFEWYSVQLSSIHSSPLHCNHPLRSVPTMA
jgi:hypothetical protein